MFCILLYCIVYCRFGFLNNIICFDDEDTREERWKEDKAASIRSVFERWNNNCAIPVQVMILIILIILINLIIVF